MSTFGHLALGTSQTAGSSGDKKFALKTVAPEDGLVTRLFVDLENPGVDIQAFRAAVYNDAPTVSGATLVDVSDAILISPGMLRQFVPFTGIAAPVIGGFVYWLTLHTGPIGGNAKFGYDAGVGNELLGTDAFSDGTSATFGTATTAVNSVAIYAEYVPTTQEVPGVSFFQIGDEAMLVGVS